jgi:transposase
MLGRRNPQRSLFEAQAWPHRVPTDSFYARLGAVMEQLFSDDDLATLYCLDNGRPSLPPSLLSGILLLQFYDDVSDAEAIARLAFDLRWKVALTLALDFDPPHPSSLSVFRGRLLEHSQERYAFDRLLAVGRAAGFLPEKITVLIDTTPQLGAGAVQDTYTLIRKGIRRVLKAAGYQAAAKRRGLASNLATYLESDHKAEIDWNDARARAAQLKVLVADAHAALDLALPACDDAEVRAAGWLLTKILGDDVVTDEQGDPQIGRGVAPDRVISLTDPEMRHGHKSEVKHFDGRKVQVATDAASELVLAVEPTPANRTDGAGLLARVEAIETQTGVTVEQVLGDTSYGTADNRAACAARGVELFSPLPEARDPAVAKAAFNLDLNVPRVTCPTGQTTTTVSRAYDPQGRPVRRFHFPRAICEACALFARCVHSQTDGRTITSHYHEGLLQTARTQQATPEFKETYRNRAAVERKIADLVEHGLRRARYIGHVKVRLQNHWVGAVVNLKRLFRLFQGDTRQMRQMLATVNMA